ncbi:MAG: ACT domain-containing protein [Victivallales bacterium]|nr:ACT domain-containing protein [Victivallales bacterium]
MAIRQLSIFLENRSGRLQAITGILAEASIDIRGLSVADTSDFGILRIIVDDTAKAEAVLKANNVVFHTNDVTAIEVDHKPGGLAKVLRLLQDTSVNVEYMYTLAVPCGVNPVLILRFNEPQEVRAKLRQNGVKLLDESDLGMK